MEASTKRADIAMEVLSTKSRDLHRRVTVHASDVDDEGEEDEMSSEGQRELVVVVVLGRWKCGKLGPPQMRTFVLWHSVAEQPA